MPPKNIDPSTIRLFKKTPASPAEEEDDGAALAREVIQETPPEERGRRPEWETHEGWSRKEDTRPRSARRLKHGRHELSLPESTHGQHHGQLIEAGFPVRGLRGTRVNYLVNVHVNLFLEFASAILILCGVAVCMLSKNATQRRRAQEQEECASQQNTHLRDRR